MVRSCGFRRLSRWGVGALVLLLAQGLGAPGLARAGCNHLVTSQSERQLDVNRLDELIVGSSAPAHSEPGPKRPRPCSGPGCSSSIPRPAPTATTGPVGPDQWATLDAALGSPLASPARLAPQAPSARPDGHRPSIFHPPPA